MNNQMLDHACRQAAKFSQQLAVRGTPRPAPNVPVPGQPIVQEQIVLVANRGQYGRNYLTRAHRVSMFNQIQALDIPDKHQLQLRGTDDVDLCRAWMQAHSWDFVKRAMGIWPKKPVIRERKYS